MMEHSSSSWTSLALAVAILVIVCCFVPCSAFEDGQDTINAASYKAHEPQGIHVGWRPPVPGPKRPCRTSYPNYGSQYALVPPSAAALNDGQEVQPGAGTAGGGDRQGWKPPSPWGRPGYGHR